jgi:thiol-disulfide isomerase/thioredoxin
MKRRALLPAPLAMWTLMSRQAAAAPASKGQSVAWPDVTLLDGTHLNAADWHDRAAVVVFWSTTCPYCRRHNQHLQKLHEAAMGLPLRVLGVASEHDAAVVRQFAQRAGYGFPLTLDRAPLAAALSERTRVPLTAVVTRQGLLKQVLPGEMAEADVMELLQLALAPQGSQGARG